MTSTPGKIAKYQSQYGISASRELLTSVVGKRTTSNWLMSMKTVIYKTLSKVYGGIKKLRFNKMRMMNLHVGLIYVGNLIKIDFVWCEWQCERVLVLEFQCVTKWEEYHETLYIQRGVLIPFPLSVIVIIKVHFLLHNMYNLYIDLSKKTLIVLESYDNEDNIRSPFIQWPHTINIPKGFPMKRSMHLCHADRISALSSHPKIKGHHSNFYVQKPLIT